MASAWFIGTAPAKAAPILFPGNGTTVALNRFVVEIGVPDSVWNARMQLTSADLDPAWNAVPAGIASIQAGSRWLMQASSALLLVPSVIVPEECAVLINPVHADARKLVATTRRRFDYFNIFRTESRQ